MLAQEQYVLIHDALKDHITCGDTRVEAYQLRLVIHDMDKEEDGQSGFEKQFEVLRIYSYQVLYIHNIRMLILYISMYTVHGYMLWQYDDIYT